MRCLGFGARCCSLFSRSVAGCASCSNRVGKRSTEGCSAVLKCFLEGWRCGGGGSSGIVGGEWSSMLWGSVGFIVVWPCMGGSWRFVGRSVGVGGVLGLRGSEGQVVLLYKMSVLAVVVRSCLSLVLQCRLRCS